MAKRKFNFAAGAEQNTPDTPETQPQTQSTPEESKSAVQTLVEKIDAPINTAFNFKYIKRDKIIFHAKNDYPMEEIEKLADSILNFGLIHNLEVFYDLENDQYILDSGERRTRAIDYLVEKYKDYPDKDNESYQKYLHFVAPFENGYPCNVKSKYADTDLSETDSDLLEQIDAEIRLIIANEETRSKDTQRTKQHVDRLNELYTKRNQTLKKGEKINVNNEIAKQLNISDKQVKNYKDIDKLIPELRKKFEENEVSLKDGANYAKLTEEEQRQILTLIENGENRQEINRLMDQMKAMRSDISIKENQISELEYTIENQNAIIKSINDAQKDLKQQLAAEQEKGDPNNEKIRELESSLDNLKNQISAQKKSLKDTVKEKDNMIADLQKKLDAQAKMQSTETNNNSKMIRTQYDLEIGIETLITLFADLEKKLDEYKAVSEDSEDFRKKIQSVIKENGKKFS